MLKLKILSLGILSMRGITAPYLVIVNKVNVDKGDYTRNS